MTAPPPDAAARRILSERTHQTYTLSVWGQPAGVLAAAMLAFGLWIAGGSPWLGAWVIAKLAVLGWETRVGLAYFRSDALERGNPRWGRSLTIGCTLLGMLWAALPLWLTPSGSTLETVVIIALVGVMAASLGTLSASAPAFFGYVVPPLLSLATIYFIRGEAGTITLGALALLYVAFLVGVQRTLGAQFIERVLTQLSNEELVARLQRADAALNKSLAEHQLLFDLASVGIAEIRDHTIVRANAQLEHMLGHPAGALLGAPVACLYPEQMNDDSVGEIRDTLARGVTVERDVRVRRRDGDVLWAALASRAIDPAHPDRGLIAVFTDITDRREREAAMQRLAHEDALTGLPNRRLLEDRLQHALQRVRRRGGGVALLLIDLDGFKQINDRHGHDIGDQLLSLVGARLLGCVRASDTVSRIGGDEFVVLLDDPVHPGDATGVAQKLVAAASEPIALAGHVMHVGASVGISMAPRDGMEGETLLRCADAAMYRAKQSGRGVWRAYAEVDRVG